MIVLWDHPLSPYAQKVKIALEEKGLAYEAPLPGGIGAGTTGGDFVAASPRAEVPALVDGELSVFDSTVILEYLEDAYPDPALLPAAPAERARVRMLEEVVDTHYEAINWGISELTWFGRGKDGPAEALRTRADEQTRGMFAWLERQLGTREWFNGEAFGWGDLSVVPYVNGSVGHGNAPAEGTPLARWLARANERSSVRKAIEDVRALAQAGGGMEPVADLLEKGLFKREYRDHRLEWMVKSGGIAVVTDGLAKNNIRFSPDFA
jgi:glutathione S-transferase/RNA polymerase-associated protein